MASKSAECARRVGDLGEVGASGAGVSLSLSSLRPLLPESRRRKSPRCEEDLLDLLETEAPEDIAQSLWYRGSSC